MVTKKEQNDAFILFVKIFEEQHGLRGHKLIKTVYYIIKYINLGTLDTLLFQGP